MDMRLATYLLFAGDGISLAAKKAGVGREFAAEILRELKEAGCGPKAEGPFSIIQAGVVLAIQPRLVRRYCQHRRIKGQENGSRYMISRAELLRFGAKPRQVGQPGQWAMREERNAKRRPRKKAKANAGS